MGREKFVVGVREKVGRPPLDDCGKKEEGREMVGVRVSEEMDSGVGRDVGPGGDCTLGRERVGVVWWAGLDTGGRNTAEGWDGACCCWPEEITSE